MIRTDTESIELMNYWESANALTSLIRGERAETRTASGRRQRAVAKLTRVRTLLDALGSPHLRYPVVHVTGTSGKGSTSASIAATLTASGYRVGLRTSPYLQVAAEKLQIGQSLIDAASFSGLVREILRECARLFPTDGSGQQCGYAEVWTALSYQWFAERAVDLAVVEVGAGGRFDTTNVITPVVSVITSVGMDHIVSLGPTISDIAWHKAGIIKPGSIAVVGEVPAEAEMVIATEAGEAGAPMIRAHEFAGLEGVQPGMPGECQLANARVAAGAIAALRQQGFQVASAALPAGISRARLPGRMERMPCALSEVWIDGAHNADKIAALARETSDWRGMEKPIFVLGILGAKDARSIVRQLAPVASAFVATEPAVVGKRSLEAASLAKAIRECGFTGDVHVELEPEAALLRAERLALPRKAPVVVTGSMYLAGQVRRRWYADDDIILQRTPWPRERMHPTSGANARSRVRQPV